MISPRTCPLINPPIPAASFLQPNNILHTMSIIWILISLPHYIPAVRTSSVAAVRVPRSTAGLLQHCSQRVWNIWWRGPAGTDMDTTRLFGEQSEDSSNGSVEKRRYGQGLPRRENYLCSEV